MFRSNPMLRRIALGKLLGLAVGLAGFILIPILAQGIDPMLRWAFLFWYIILGAVVALVGIVDRYPVFDLPYPWWLRGTVTGAWLNFVIVLFAYQSLGELAVSIFGVGGLFNSPWWLILEGAMVGAAIDGICTAVTGDGRKLYPAAA